MALGGLRDLSLITTPPAARCRSRPSCRVERTWRARGMPARAAPRRQVYFVHNAIETIEGMGQRLASSSRSPHRDRPRPDARARPGAGDARLLPRGRTCCCARPSSRAASTCRRRTRSSSTVPTVRPRPAAPAARPRGRSHHQAYATCHATEERVTSDARKRLEALESLEDLGRASCSPPRLEIRGAGELARRGQSGQIQEIGFALYMELLERAVAALRAGRCRSSSARCTTVRRSTCTSGPAARGYLPDVHARWCSTSASRP